MPLSPPAPPARVARLPTDKHGRPVPWFVAWIEGVPDFRIVAQGKVDQAVRFAKCFICGDGLGGRVTFAVGPLCTINRTAPEPPAHKDCAIYAAQSCPFLARPGMRRRTAGLPEGLRLETHAPGLAVEHNPGVTAIWTTRRRQAFSDDKGGLLFRMGDPDEVLWFAEGRPATRNEAQEALESEHAVLEERMQADAGRALSKAERAALKTGFAEAFALLPA